MDSNLQDALLDALDRWGTPHTPNEMQDLLQARHGLELAQEAIDLLTRSRYLLQTDKYDPADRYSRHHLYYALSGSQPDHAQAQLAASTVALVGCGGIGNVVASLLMAAGIERLMLLDDDVVEESNLTRQIMFTEADVGRPKVSALAERLSERNRSVAVTALCDRASPATLKALGNPNLLILSADGPGVLPMVNEHCVNNGIPFLHVCYVEDIAVWGPLVVPGTTGCWSCTQLVADDNPRSDEQAAISARISSGYQPPSFGPINALASSMAAMDAIKYLTSTGQPESLGRRVGIWTHALRLEYHECPKNPECATCADKP